MALWTPYADDIALDLSTSSKENCPSPESSIILGYQYGYNTPHISSFAASYASMPHISPLAASYAPMPHISPLAASYAPMPQMSPYPSPFATTYTHVPHISPASAASASSYEVPVTPQLSSNPERSVTPHMRPRVQTLSPPISPQSQKRPYSMIDDSLSDDPDFQAFERNALRAMAEKNGGALLANNPRMRRSVQSTSETNDDTYRRQRERNNVAAKQSRDRRKLREIHLALKVSYLRKEVASLKTLLASRACRLCHDTCTC